MSSLTTIGVNKNKKGFAPKIAKRKERKPAGAAAVGSSKGKETEDKISITSERTSTTVEITSISTVTASLTAAVTSTTTTENIISEVSMQHASSPGAIDPKIEPLTEEELAMNAITARPKRRKPAAQPDNDTEEDEQAQARGPKKRVPQVVSAPSPISASSPLNAPSPVAPLANERANCAFEQQTGPVLKIERLTPDVRSKLYSSEQPVGSPVPPKQDDDMDYDELLAQEPNEDQEIPASPLNNIPKSTRASTRIRSKPANTVAEAEPSTTTTTRSKPAARSKSAAKSKASKAAAVIAPNDATPKRGTKRKAAVAAGTAVSIGIGVPSVSSSSRITEVDQLEPSADSSSEDDGNNGRRRHRRKRREQGLTRKPHKYAYREVQNLRTLDDITNDPASTDNLDKPMAAFTKDMDGIVSKMFKEMEMVRAEKKKKDEAKTNMTEDELAELKKKEEEDAELEARRKQIAKERDAEKRRREQEGQILAESSNAVQVRLVNGEIVLDTDTLTVERTEAAHDYGDGAMEIVEENSMSKKVNSQTYGKRKQSAKWDAVETETFFDCISQFGTDFEMISKMLLGRTRNQVRQKFNREEKLNPAKVTEYLVKKRKPLDIEKYKKMAGIEELEEVPDDFHEMTIA